MRAADKKLAALVAKHPDLEHPRPLVEMFTRTGGEKVYGCWVDDFDRIFPPSLNQISTGDPILRAAFEKRAQEALPVQIKRRTAVGIEQADAAAAQAHGDVMVAFRRIKAFSPRTIAEMRLQVMHFVRVLPEIHEGPVFWGQKPEGKPKTSDWLSRRSWAFNDVEDLLRALVRRA